MKQTVKKAWAAWKEQRKARRVARFKAQFAQAYPDAVKFIEQIIWLNGQKAYIIDAHLHVDNVTVYHQLTEEEMDAVKKMFE